MRAIRGRRPGVSKCAPYLALALLAASRPALAERVAFQAPPPPPPERGREIVTTSTIDVASLPVADVPAPFATTATRPSDLGEPATDLAIATPAELTRFRTSTSSSSFAIKVVGTGSTTAVLSTAPASRSSSLRADGWVSCERSSRAFQPLRWETLVVDASGEGAAWTVNDGWVDRSTCQATRARTTQVRLRRVAAGAGIAFAGRTSEGLVVVTPAADSIVGDATMGEMRGSRGPISRVFLPIARGGASAAALSFDATRAAAWLTNAGATSTKPAAPGRVTLRLDASQTVAEATPSVLVRVAVLPSLGPGPKQRKWRATQPLRENGRPRSEHHRTTAVIRGAQSTRPPVVARGLRCAASFVLARALTSATPRRRRRRALRP